MSPAGHNQSAVPAPLPAPRFFYLYVCVTGAAVMMLEFAASRVVAPWFGSSIFVWGNIIGAVLIALSLGYYYGGRLADRRPNMRTLTIIVVTAGLLATGIPIAIGFVTRNVSLFDVYFNSSILFTIIGSFIVIVGLFALPVGLLGMVSPFVIRLATTKVESAGAVAGGLYAWSTVGSILGTFGTAFIFIPLLGSRETILLSAAGLLGIAAVGWRKSIWLWLALVLPLIVYLVVGRQPLRADAATITSEESMYQFIQVADETDRLTLIFNEGLGTQSYYMKEGVLTDSYYDYLALLPEIITPPQIDVAGATAAGNNVPSALVLGLAGGTMTRELQAFYPAYQLTGVELDPAVVRLAREYFSLDEQNIVVVEQDGRTFLQSTEETYDLIYVDAYANEYYIPWHLTTVEFFQAVASQLKSGGAVAMNIGSTAENSRLLQAFLATLSEVFPYVSVASVPGSLNYIVVASQTKIDVGPLLQIADERQALADALYTNWHTPTILPAATVLTDNRAPIELYTEGMIWNYILTQ